VNEFTLVAMRASRGRWGQALLGAVGLACGGRAALDDDTSAGGGGAALGQRPDRQPPAPSGGNCSSAYCVGATPPSYGTGGANAPPPSSGSAGSSSTSGTGGFGFGDVGFGGSGFAGSVGTGAASGGSGGSSGAPPVDTPSAPLLPRTLTGATAIVSDPVRERFYVAVGANVLRSENSIVTLEPSSGAVLSEVPVSATPDSLAISDDGTTLWVGLHDASTVLKVDLSGEVPVPLVEYALPPTDAPPYPLAAGPMVVLPGTTSSLAVSLHYDGLSPSLAGVVVLDEGVARPLRLPSHTGASRLTRGPDGYLLGFNNLHTGFGVYTISVSADGLTQTEHANLVAGFDTDIVFDSGLLFGTDGAVISFSSPEFPLPLGRLPVTGQVFPHLATDAAWVLQEADPQAEATRVSLVLVQLATREVFGRTDFGTLVRRPRHFIRSANGVFAFIADPADATGFELDSGVHWMRP
jgi:hypothetical protein